MTAESRQSGICLNCAEPHSGNYCSNCGQATSTTRLTVRSVLRDGLEQWFNFDSAVVRTLIDLTTRPATVCANYVSGHRKTYVSPIRYFLVCSALMLLIHAMFGVQLEDVGSSIAQGDTDTQKQVQSEVSALIVNHLNLIQIAVVWVLAGVLRLLFRRSGRNYAEVSVFTLYIMAQGFLFSTVLFWLIIWNPRLYVLAKWLIHYGYITWAAIGFFNTTLFWSACKNMVALAFNYLAITVIALLIVLPRIIEFIRASSGS